MSSLKQSNSDAVTATARYWFRLKYHGWRCSTPVRCCVSAVLTQQYDGAQEDGDERPRANASRAAQSLRITQLHVAVAVTGAHPHSEGPRAALHGVVAVCDHHGNQVDALVKSAVAGSPCQDAGGVIWEKKKIIRRRLQSTCCVTWHVCKCYHGKKKCMKALKVTSLRSVEVCVWQQREQEADAAGWHTQHYIYICHLIPAGGLWTVDCGPGP